MIYALYGCDTYRSRKKINQIIDEYRKKAGDGFNLHRFHVQNQELGELKAIMEAQSLFTTKKLVVLESAFAGACKDIFPFAKKWKDARDHHLVLFHELLDAQAKKELKAWNSVLTQSQEFDELKGVQKEQWIRREALERGVSLTLVQLRALRDNVLNSWAVVQEIEKIAIGGSGGIQTTIAKPTVFDFGDAFFTDRKRAIGILHRLLQHGEDDFGLFSYLVNRSRALVAIKQCAVEKRQIPSWFGIHPFVAKKTEILARALTSAQCTGFMRRFFEEDVKIKTGLSQPRDSLLRILTESRLLSDKIVGREIDKVF